METKTKFRCVFANKNSRSSVNTKTTYRGVTIINGVKVRTGQRDSAELAAKSLDLELIKLGHPQVNNMYKALNKDK